jgi:hypothetical protein
MPEIIHGAAACSPAFFERLNGDVQTYLVPVSEAIDDGLGGEVHLHRHALDPVFLDAGSERGLGEVRDAQGTIRQARPPGLLSDSQPDFKRCLGRQFVKAQGGQQADDAVGDTLANLGQRVVFGDTAAGENIEPSRKTLQPACGTERDSRMSGGCRSGPDPEVLEYRLL